MALDHYLHPDRVETVGFVGVSKKRKYLCRLVMKNVNLHWNKLIKSNCLLVPLVCTVCVALQYVDFYYVAYTVLLVLTSWRMNYHIKLLISHVQMKSYSESYFHLSPSNVFNFLMLSISLLDVPSGEYQAVVCPHLLPPPPSFSLPDENGQSCSSHYRLRGVGGGWLRGGR